MKIVVQDFKTGELSVADAPMPAAAEGGALVRVSSSLISVGTDRAIIGLARKGPLGKALDRPDLARKVINKARTDGPWATYKVVKNLLAEPIPLGYSLVGTVVQTRGQPTDLAPGDRVACAGLGHANHAEFVSMPRNLVARVPDAVDDESAAYVTLGAIAMHGLRQADQQIGATVAVVGLGLLGQIVLQIGRAAGYKTIGIDLDPRKVELALRLGATAAAQAEDASLESIVKDVSRGNGADAVMVTAGSRRSGAPFGLAARIARDRARVVVVGDVRMDISRRDYFEKELEILQSRSYGPGRYDPQYEEKGQDYPIGYVRWTERRNMESFLDLVASGSLDLRALTTHRFGIGDAHKAYALVTAKTEELLVGVTLRYDGDEAETSSSETRTDSARTGAAPRGAGSRLGLGVIGTGRFAKGVLLPALVGTGGFAVTGVASARGLSAKTVSERYGARFATSDAQRVLDDDEVQAVVIATRHGSHGRYVVEALARDKHVFVEKPLCLTADELGAIADAARRSKGTLMVGYNRRFSGLMAEMRKHFDGFREPKAIAYRVNAGRIPLKGEMAWVHDPVEGGGRIMGEVCHFVDALQFLIQATPTSVHASAVAPRRSDLASDDIVTVTIGFDDGSSGTVHYWSNGDPSYPKERIEMFASERIAVLENFRSLELVAGNKTRKVRRMNLDKGFEQEAAAFLAACRGGEAAIPLESLLATTQVTLLAVEDLQGRRDAGPAAGTEA